MDFRLLGPVAVRAGGANIGLGSAKERLLLAALALDAGRPVTQDTLVRCLWDEGRGPEHPDQSVWSYVSRLRRRLAAAAEPVELAGKDHTYVLRADPEAVDWHRYRRLVAEAESAADEQAVELLARADRLWEGDALGGLRGDWAAAVRHSLAEQRVAAQTSRIAATLRLGRFAEPIGELLRLTADRPVDETLLGHLMLAYYGRGRYSDALGVYERARRELRNEFGSAPGPMLERIRQGMLHQVPAGELLRPPRASGPTSARTAAVRGASGQPPAAPRGGGSAVPPRVPVPRNLPAQPPLVGRRAELERLTAEFGAAADPGGTPAVPPAAGGGVVTLETVSGMPGVGKTALAVHTAHRLSGNFPSGQVYLNLRGHVAGQEPLTTGAAVAALLRLAGVPAPAIPVGVDEQAAMWRDLLARRRMVIVLDDVADAAQIRPLLPVSSPALVVLTSRRHLTGLPAARTVQLDVLPPEDAIALFRTFAGRDRTGDDGELAHIVQLCGYLPLAIELAAARFQAHQVWTLTTLRERLSTADRLDQLRSADSAIETVFELSYRDLTAPQRSAFRRLSLHPGPDFTAPAAAAMLDLPVPAAEWLLEQLLGFHLIREPVPDRFAFHDLVRAYAQRQARAEDPQHTRSAVITRLTAFYTRTTTQADRLAHPRRPQLGPPPAPAPGDPAPASAAAARAWLAAERDNVLSVEAHARSRGEGRLAALLGYAAAGHLEAECHWADAADVLTAAADVWADGEQPEALCRTLAALTEIRTKLGDYASAAASGARALELAEASGASELHADVLRVLATLAWQRGELDRALTLLERAFALRADSTDVYEISRLHNNLGTLLTDMGDTASAVGHLERALEGFTAAGDRRSAGFALNNLAAGRADLGSFDVARQNLEEAVAVLDTAGNRHDQALVRATLAEILGSLGETSQALSLYGQTYEVFVSLGDRKNQLDNLLAMGEIWLRTADREEAMASFTEAFRLAEALGAAREATRAQRGLDLAKGLDDHRDGVA